MTSKSLPRREFLGQALGAAALATTAGSTLAQTKPTIKLGFVDGWADSVATTNLAASIIHEKLGYPVEMVPLAAGIMWQGVARGDIDATLSAWLPVTHEAYMTANKEKVQDLGSNYPGARIGLIVPDYVKPTSLENLNASKADFDNRIVGIDAGAGVMKKTEEAIKAYGLDMRLQPSSGPAMTAELDRSIRAHKAIAVTGWIPHWMFAKYKLRFLADPKNIYGAEEHVDTVVNPNLKTKAPAVYAFLQKLSWKPEEIGTVMLGRRERRQTGRCGREVDRRQPGPGPELDRLRRDTAMQPQLPIEVDPRSGIWTTDGLPMIYVPRHFFVNNHVEAEKSAGREEYADGLYRAGYRSAYFWCEQEAKTHGLEGMAVYEHYLKRLSQRGWGPVLVPVRGCGERRGPPARELGVRAGTGHRRRAGPQGQALLSVRRLVCGRDGLGRDEHRQPRAHDEPRDAMRGRRPYALRVHRRCAVAFLSPFASFDLSTSTQDPCATRISSNRSG